MLILDPKATILDAADMFAAQYSDDDEPRTVGEVVDVSNAAINGQAIDFRLTGGTRWYEIRQDDKHRLWRITIK